MDFKVDFDPNKVKWRQIRDQLRSQIHTGKLPVGTKLPPTADLAVKTGTDVMTLQRALADLVSEGLITRAKGVGTFVAQRKNGLTSVGIFHLGNIYRNQDYAFLRVLQGELQKLAEKSNVAVKVWFDERPIAKQNLPLREIEDAARNRTIQGLITTASSPHHQSWLKRLPIPISYFASGSNPAVDFDNEDFFNVSLTALKKKGCRTVALMTWNPARADFCKLFFSTCRRLGLETKDEWLLTHEPDDGHTFDSFAFEATQKLWKRRPRPDGLIAHPDSVAFGTLMGLATQQVRIPEELQLVLHRNKELDLFCPYPATFVTCSAQEAAQALFKQLGELLKGSDPGSTYVKFHAES